MDFRSVKNLMIGGRAVSKLLVGGRLVWRKAEPAPPEPVVDGAYIETDGVASYMDLGLVPGTGTSYEIDCMYVSGSYTGTSALRNSLYGASAGTATTLANFVAYVRPSLGHVGFAKPNSVSAFTEFVPGRRSVVRLSGTSISVDDHVETVMNNYAATTSMKLGCSYPGSADFYSVTRFYAAKFWQDGVLVRDLVPYSGPRGVGLLDKVHDVLYTNAGGGVLTYGVEGGAWTNPYITDGLFSMWDAEWNEAGGVHNPDLMQMNDLMGRLGAVPVYDLGGNWAKRAANFVFNLADYPALGDFASPGADLLLTVDACHTYDSSIPGSGVKYALNLQVSFTNDAGATSTVARGCGVYSDGNLFLMRGALAFFRPGIPARFGSGITSCVAASYANSSASGYIDGENVGDYEGTPVENRVANMVRMNSTAPGAAYADAIRTNCIRVYNRVLTPEEVAHNARVDRERFGN